ncbi:hypothetical protein BSKO_11610 [Bryopsis sp. KO-2023]|nr:hypothetical protein BSKO_11610 [Bryopsis sp. KO-2023]
MHSMRSHRMSAGPQGTASKLGKPVVSIPSFRGMKSNEGVPGASSAPRTAEQAFRARLTSAIRSSAGAVTGGALTSTSGLNLVFVSAEVTPWSKTGGLGDVIGGLPIELAKKGHKVMTIAPRYDQYSDGWDTSITVEVCGEQVRFFHAKKKGVDRVFVDHPWFLAKVWGKTGSKLYGKKSGADFRDNQKRFRLFCEAAIEATRVLPFGPGENCTFIANDWHSGLIPVLLKDYYQKQGEFTSAKCIFCLHNIAFQGRFWPEDFDHLSLPEISRGRFAFQDGYPVVFDEDLPVDESNLPKRDAMKPTMKINWMRAALTAADKILTVSPNYAQEIMSGADKGVELDGVIRKHGGAEGIVNGMDVTEWSPTVDKYLDVKYDAETMDVGKAVAKETLQAEAGLDVDPTVPIVGFIGRLEEQKGVDIMMKALPKIVASGKVQVVILGTGKKKFETALKAMDGTNNFKGIIKFSPRLAHLITAGADFMLVPSRFEPCGLIQLHAMQYGTIPIVSNVGGLVDTVKEGETGFHICEMDLEDILPANVEAIAETVTRAANTFGTPAFEKMRSNCIAQDLSWAKPAKKWEATIEELLDGGKKESTDKKQSVKTPVVELTSN